MSLRNEPASTPAHQLRNGLSAMRNAELIAQRDAEISASVDAAPSDAGLTMSDLSAVERSAASLGVSADEWKPIGFLNSAHYESLLKSNALSENLAKGVEAYKVVAAGGH